MNRPLPPADLVDFIGTGAFRPAFDLADWVRETIIQDDAALFNPDHQHLQQANIGYLWTNTVNEKRGRMILGTAQILPPSGEKWAVARTIAQLEEWFGVLPDALITIYAPEAAVMDDASFCALIEHENYHIAQRTDSFGGPMFDKETGKPVLTSRGHDVEQFVGVVRRYGARASMVQEMVDAANAGAEIAEARLAFACGNCLRLVA